MFASKCVHKVKWIIHNIESVYSQSTDWCRWLLLYFLHDGIQGILKMCCLCATSDNCHLIPPTPVCSHADYTPNPKDEREDGADLGMPREPSGWRVIPAVIALPYLRGWYRSSMQIPLHINTQNVVTQFVILWPYLVRGLGMTLSLSV